MALFGKPDPKPEPKPGTPPSPGGNKEGAAPAAPSTPTPSAAGTVPGLAVRAVPRAGFWRADRFWTPEIQLVPLSDLTEEQIQLLREEPELAVEAVDIPTVPVTEA